MISNRCYVKYLETGFNGEASGNLQCKAKLNMTWELVRQRDMRGLRFSVSKKDRGFFVGFPHVQ